MSRVGKKPIPIPQGVNVEVKQDIVKVKGPKGELKYNFPEGVKMSVSDGQVVVERSDDTKSRRVVQPISIEQMEYKGKGFEGLRAYCLLRGGERTFRIDRILEISYAVG